MKTYNFEKLIQSITGRELIINTEDKEIIGGKEYRIYKILPITNREIGFKWKAAIDEEKMLRSFITAFCLKYKEPNPANYTTCAPYFSPSWEEMPDTKKEYAYCHHSSNMFCKDELMKQVEFNFNKESMQGVLMKYGFYSTLYGIGIFSLFESKSIIKSIQAMKDYLTAKNIPFKNEYSDARWVYRFKLNMSKEIHSSLIDQFGNPIPSNEQASKIETNEMFLPQQIKTNSAYQVDLFANY
jgi:hypothetical protein